MKYFHIYDRQKPRETKRYCHAGHLYPDTRREERGEREETTKHNLGNIKIEKRVLLIYKTAPSPYIIKNHTAYSMLCARLQTRCVEEYILI